MAYVSTIQILKIETQQTKRINPETGKPNEFRVARTALIDDDGQIETVGRLRIPKALDELVKVGTFRASFALQVPDYGDNKGDVVSVLVGLVPVTSTRSTQASATASKG